MGHSTSTASTHTLHSTLPLGSAGRQAGSFLPAFFALPCPALPCVLCSREVCSVCLWSGVLLIYQLPQVRISSYSSIILMKFKAVRKIGEGANASVFEAVSVESQERMAVKVIDNSRNRTESHSLVLGARRQREGAGTASSSRQVNVLSQEVTVLRELGACTYTYIHTYL